MLNRLQFSIRTLLLLTAIVALCMGSWAWFGKPKPFKPNIYWMVLRPDHLRKTSSLKAYVELTPDRAIMMFDTEPYGTLDGGFCSKGTVNYDIFSTDTPQLAKLYSEVYTSSLNDKSIQYPKNLTTDWKSFTTSLYHTSLKDWNREFDRVVKLRSPVEKPTSPP